MNRKRITKPLLQQHNVSGSTSLHDRLLEKFPTGYKKYRRNCFLIEHKELDIMVQVSKFPKNLFCCLYSYVEGGKKFAIQPIMFKGDEEKVAKTISTLTPALQSKNADEFYNQLELLSEILKKDMILVNFGS